jgi:purine-binding chemotaxis protein CheW
MTSALRLSTEGVPMLELVTFHVHSLVFGAPISDVRETIELRPITPLFHVPRCLAGIANLRGEILAVLDVAALLGLETTRRGPESRIVIVEQGGRAAGLIVDRLDAILSVPKGSVTEAPPTLSPDVARLLMGIVSLPERSVAVLDLARLFASPELAPFTRGEMS